MNDTRQGDIVLSLVRVGVAFGKAISSFSTTFPINDVCVSIFGNHLVVLRPIVLLFPQPCCPVT